MARIRKLLVANRGEIAVRVVRAARELGIRTCAVYEEPDHDALHCRVADEAFPLPLGPHTRPSGRGGAAASPTGVGSRAHGYLCAESIIEVAKHAGADAIHPGYGFLSESGSFARACLQASIAFVGPSPATLDLFGDKTQARALAERCGVPVLAATAGAVSTAREAEEFAAAVGYPLMVKALHGGGGKGMRAVTSSRDLHQCILDCESEVAAAFGVARAGVYMEEMMPDARHIEVQVMGDAQGGLVHLHERDCSVQVRHQKVLEIAPAPHLDPQLRSRLLADAINMAREAGVHSAVTFEFLVRAGAPDGTSGPYAFIEANPRIQVEHTVTEEVTGVDVVQTQLQVAAGATLRDLGLASPPPCVGFAVQARVTASPGRVTAFHAPQGPGVRVDSCAAEGVPVPVVYDGLLAKVVCRNRTLAGAVERLKLALRDLSAEGVSLNTGYVLSVLSDPRFADGNVTTSTFTGLQSTAETAAAVPGSATSASPGVFCVVAPGPGLLKSMDVGVGDHIQSPSTTVGVMTAMKMDSRVPAGGTGIVTRVVARPGDILRAGATIVEVAEGAEGAGPAPETAPPEGTAAAARRVGTLKAHLTGWQPEVDEMRRRRDLARAMGGADGVERQRAAGKLNVRQRIAALLDDGTFREVGGLVGSAVYDEDGARVTDLTPGNFLAGRGAVDGRGIVVGADDFTIRGGHSSGMSTWQKQEYAEGLAVKQRLPMVRLLDGSSGGGSVAAMLDMEFSYVPRIPGMPSMAAALREVPVAAALLGPVVGLGAARASLSHFAVMVKDVAQLFVAGPPVVRHAAHETVTKEQLGGWAVVAPTGAVDSLAESEADALCQVRSFLGYLPSSAWDLPARKTPPPPGTAAAEALAGCQEHLIQAIPRARAEVYDVRAIVRTLVDTGSFFEVGGCWGKSAVCGLARIDGFAVGVISSDCASGGGVLTAAAADKVRRHVDLCDTFHLPVVVLVDQPGFAVGSRAESEGTIRKGASLMVALAQAEVPWFTVIMRRAFGVAGAAFAHRDNLNDRVAWPSGDWGSLPLEGGLEAAFKRALRQAPDPAALEAELLGRFAALRDPQRTALAFGIEDIIDPRLTRPRLCEWAADAYRRLAHADGPQPRPGRGYRP